MKFRISCMPLIAVIAVVVLFLPVTCPAAGKFIIKPKISGSWQIDSNFYKSENNEREVYTYLLKPGIELGYETARSMLLLDYTLNAYDYDDKDDIPSGQESAGKDDYVGHIGTFTARTSPFDRLTLGLDESYYKTRDPAASDRFSNSTDRDKFMINRLTPTIFYEFKNKFAAGLRYRNTITDYDSSTGEDSMEHRGMFDLIYNLNRSTSLDLEYKIWTLDYDLASSDYISNQLKLIGRKQYRYFSFEAGAGYHDRNFDDSDLEDIDIVTYRIAATCQNPPPPETQPRSYITLVSELNFNDLGVGDSYYKAHRLTLDAGHIFLEKISVNIGGYYQKSDYESTEGLTSSGSTELRDDDTYNISGSIGYKFTDWLTSSVKTGYEERNSNLAGYDYENTFFMIQLDLIYNLGRR